MDFMSSLWEQNPKQNQRRHSFEKLSSLLPEMQTGDANRSGEFENNRYSKAGTLIKICNPPCIGKP